VAICQLPLAKSKLVCLNHRLIVLGYTKRLYCYLYSCISSGAESEKDTKEEELKEVTFKPKLCTFEQDIMNVMGIKETRKRAKTYWY